MTTAPSPRRRGLALVTLWTVGVSWPLLSRMAADGTSLLARQPTAFEVLGLALVTTLVAPCGLTLLLRLAAGAKDPVSRALPHVVVGVLAAATMLHAIGRALPDEGISGDVLLVVAALFAAGATFAWMRWAPLQRLAALTSPLSLVVLVAFALDDDVAPLLIGADAPGAAPVVVLAFDELPTGSLLDADGRVDATLFPNMARLAETGVIFTNASTVHEDGDEALAAMISGRRPGSVDTDAPDLFALLAPTHRVVVGGPGVSTRVPEALLLGERPPTGKLSHDALIAWLSAVLPPPFDRTLPAAPGRWRPQVGLAPQPAREPADPVLAARAVIASIAAAGSAPLVVLHSPLPGRPWNRLPDGSRYASLDRVTGLEDGVWEDDPWPAARGLQRHLLQLGAADRLVGELLDALDAADLAERAVIAVTATCGASFAPGSSLADATVGSAADVISVPLIVSAPALSDRAATSDDRNVEVIDLLPTLADLLQRPNDDRWEGLSVFADEPPSTFKTCARRTGDPLVLSGKALSKRADVARKTKLFGTPSDWTRVESLAPTSVDATELLGLRLAAQPPSGLHPARVQVHAVAGRPGDRPLLLEGQVLFDDPATLPKVVALAIDDVIAALAPTRRRGGGQVDFEVLLPSAAVPTAGRLGLAVYAVDEDGFMERLSVEQWTMHKDDDGRPAQLFGADGRQLAVRPDAFGAFLDLAEVGPHSVRLQGWAGDRLTSRPADAVLVFVGERFVFAHATGVERPGVVASLGDEGLLDSGFDFEVPLSLLGNDYTAHLRLFAAVDDLATPLISNRHARWITERVWTDEGALLIASDGAQATLGDADLWGALESAEARDGRLYLTGWAVDASQRSPVDEILVLVDGRSVVHLRPGTTNRSVAELFGGQEIDDAGFVTALPMAWFGDGPDARLTVIALRGARASRLRPAEGAEWVVAPAPTSEGG